MTRYVNEALHQFNHKKPKNPHNHPYKDPERTYGAFAHKMKLIDT